MIWAKERYLAAGWGQKIVSYVDVREQEVDGKQVWPKKHHDDILALAYLPPSTVVSSSYDGDIIIWSLETCQPLDRMNFAISAKPFSGSANLTKNVANTKNSLADNDGGNSKSLPADHGKGSTQQNRSVLRKTSIHAVATGLKVPQVHIKQSKSRENVSSSAREKSRENLSVRATSSATDIFNDSYGLLTKTASQLITQEKRKVVSCSGRAIEKLLFLETRRVEKQAGNLVALSAGGWILFCSIHPEGGLLALFNGAHTPGENVTAMHTDEKNRYLFTGDSQGYIKVNIYT